MVTISSLSHCIKTDLALVNGDMKVHGTTPNFDGQKSLLDKMVAL